MMSVPEYAAREGISARRVRRLAVEAKLPARKVGGRWLVDDAALAQKRPGVRPMSPRMAWLLLYRLAGLEPPLRMAPTEAKRLSERTAMLKGLDDPERLLLAWLSRRGERLVLSAAPDELGRLREDPRLQLSGISSPRAGLSAVAEIEGYVASDLLADLVFDHLLTRAGRPNVTLHVKAPEIEPLPWTAALADLAERGSPREISRVRELISELP